MNQSEHLLHTQFHDTPESLAQVSKLISSLFKPYIKIKHIHYQLEIPTLVISIDDENEYWVSENDYLCVNLYQDDLYVLTPREFAAMGESNYGLEKFQNINEKVKD